MNVTQIKAVDIIFVSRLVENIHADSMKYEIPCVIDVIINNHRNEI